MAFIIIGQGFMQPLNNYSSKEVKINLRLSLVLNPAKLFKIQVQCGCIIQFLSILPHHQLFDKVMRILIFGIMRDGIT